MMASMTGRQPYEHNRCASCAFGRASFRFCDDDHGQSSSSAPRRSSPDPHLHRICDRCGFEWITDVAGSDVEPVPIFESDQQALSVIREVAGELGAAADALDAAAYELKERDEGRAASRAKQAASRARHAQHGLTGDPPV
jgi:hypothetical protein